MSGSRVADEAYRRGAAAAGDHQSDSLLNSGLIATAFLTPGNVGVVCRTLAGLQALDALDSNEPLALGEADEANALGVASQHGNFVHRRAHECARGADEHDFAAGHDLQGCNCRAVAIGCLQGDHALPATTM